MGWQVLVPLIIQYGLPLAEQIWAKWSSNSAPSQADWDQLKQLASQNAKQQMTQALIRNGIDPASPQGVALLALVA